MKENLKRELRKRMLRDRFFPERDIDAFCNDILDVYGGFIEDIGMPFYETPDSKIEDLMYFIEDMGGYQTFDYDDSHPVTFNQ